MLSRRSSPGDLRVAVIICFATCFLASTPIIGQSVAQPTLGTPQDVLTYHGDTLRTGWFSSEHLLTPANVNPASFGLLLTVPLDGRVDAEPLVALHQPIVGQGFHDVVYVATENDSVYAIDATTGAVLWQRSLGTPVPYTYKQSDDNVYPTMGILGTPVIDRAANTLYLVADIYTGGADYFRLHALSLSSGKDLTPAGNVQFSQTLADGTVWQFKPRYQLQRAGLLLANGSLYITFGSNGDIQPNSSRGSILAYDPTTLLRKQAIATDSLTLGSNPYYLSSIWQSGYAPAADSGGDIFLSTGNSDPFTPSYSAAFNRPESVIRLSGDLGAVIDSFTPSNYFSLEGGDIDLGSGGVLLLPDQPGADPYLAVAGGKDGRAFLINRDNMGGFTPNGPDRVLQTVTMGPCWCGPAFYVGSDLMPRIVTGGGSGVISWKLITSPATQLVQEGATNPGVVNGLPDNGGVIPVISSNGTTANSAIIWFIQRPTTSSDQDPGTPVTLYAFAANNLAQPLFSLVAGTWVHATNSNANLVPTVANGRVYVASNKQLQIFGLLPAAAHEQSQSAGFTTRVVNSGASGSSAIPVSQPDRIQCPAGDVSSSAFDHRPGSIHDFYGTVCQANGTQVQLVLRMDKVLTINTAGLSQYPPLLLTPGRPVHVHAAYDAHGSLNALRISHSHTISSVTPLDR